jgi:succinyl-CoA synthetase beta subunit
LRLDAKLIEINPLAITEQGQCLALDAKVAIDDNALFRQPELARLREVEAEEVESAATLALDRRQINYVGLVGDVGLAVNGAGLGLATLDLVIAAGGRAANFMDIRTTASSQDIASGFAHLLSRPEVRALLVNVQGGGMQRCDTVAEGLAIAMRAVDRAPPIVVRFAGNNAAFAVTRLTASGVPFEQALDMHDAATRAVARASGVAG